MMHLIMVFTSFAIPQRRDQRERNVGVILARGGVYLMLFVFFTKVAILYSVAYVIMITILRFMDSLQHDYGDHNAHHAKMTAPWWQLPALHRELFGDDPALTIPFGPQLSIFHRYRVERIVGGSEDEGEDEAWGRAFLEAVGEGRGAGGNAASFLTAF